MTLARLRLTTTDLDELAAGHGTIAGQLLAGQLSKRLLQILAMLREVESRFPGTCDAGHFDLSYRTLAAARRRAAAAADKVLLHPLVGGWAAHALRRLALPAVRPEDLADDLGHFGAIAAAAALSAGIDFDLVLRVRADGTLMLPTFGLARPGPTWAAMWCRARYRAGVTGIELRLDSNHSRQLPVWCTVDSAGWFPVRRLSSEADGCRIEVELDDLDPYRDNHRLGATDRLAPTEAGVWQQRLNESWPLLVGRHRHLADSLSHGVITLVPLRGTEQGDSDRTAKLGRVVGVSATVSDACGAMAMTMPPDGIALAASLIHEFQHSKLSALLDLVPLHRAAADAVFYAPWRADPRHLHGLLHGAYAHLALVDFWRALYAAETGAQRRVAGFEFARWRRALRRVLHIIGESGLLTVTGGRFVDGMRGRLAGLVGPVPPAWVEALARIALIDHWLVWRLCNLGPDPGWLADAASAWLAGKDCPRPPPALPDPASGLPGATAHHRLELIYHRLWHPDRSVAGTALPAVAPGMIAADAHLVGSEDLPAARGYENAVTEQPDRADWWAGLTLAHHRLGTATGRVLFTRPEQLAGLHRLLRRTTGQAPAIEPLARWLSVGPG
jgi:HEXXH motif-containing protein